MSPLEIMDCLVVWAMLWAAISWLRRTPARLGLLGLATLVLLFLGARLAGLALTTWLLQGFAAVAAVTAVVVFQQDLRRLFEQIASLWLARPRREMGADVVDILTRAVAALVSRQHGALIVLPGRELLDSHLDGGIPLSGQISEPLLLSLFDPHSPGHDGAVVVRGNRVDLFAAHLPLSSDHVQLGHRGTRHAAALGISEVSDALAIAVSEERRTISVALEGRMRVLESPAELSEVVTAFLQRLTPRRTGRRAAWPLREWRAGAAALPLTMVLWLLGVPGGEDVEISREVPVTVAGLPTSYAIESIDPPEVRVVLRGPRRAAYLLRTDEVSVSVDALLVELGRRTFELSADHVSHPEGFRVVEIHPNRVKLSLRSQPKAGPAP